MSDQVRAVSFVLLALLVAFVLGIQFQRTITVNSLLHFVGLRTLYISDVAGREAVNDIDFAQADLVLLTAGQSNAANHSNFSPVAKPQLLNYFDGKLYAATAPLLGASGEGGNLVTQIGNNLVNSLGLERILLAPRAIGNTGVLEWQPGSEQYERLSRTLDELDMLVNGPLVLLWIQGEKDSRDGLSAVEYEKHLDNIFAGLLNSRSKLQIVVASHTRCRQLPVQSYSPIDSRLARRERVTMGPRLDMLSADLKYDGCHWNETGVIEIGAATAAIVQNVLTIHSLHSD